MTIALWILVVVLILAAFVIGCFVGAGSVFKEIDKQYQASIPEKHTN